MDRPKLDDKDYKALVREIGKLETRFGKLATRGAMQHYLLITVRDGEGVRGRLRKYAPQLTAEQE